MRESSQKRHLNLKRTIFNVPLSWAPLFLVAQATQPLSLHSCNVMKVSGLRRFGAALLNNILIYNDNLVLFILNKNPEYRKILSFQICLT